MGKLVEALRWTTALGHELDVRVLFLDIDGVLNRHGFHPGESIGLRSWIEAPRGRHSEKPEAVRALIERASPGPRLELFARKLTPGWYAWGHEIAEPLMGQSSSIEAALGSTEIV